MGGIEVKHTGIKLIDGLSSKHKDKIAKISDERSSGDGFWIFLAKHTNIEVDPIHGLHTIHENSITECVRQLRFAIPCKCSNHIEHVTKTIKP